MYDCGDRDRVTGFGGTKKRKQEEKTRILSRSSEMKIPPPGFQDLIRVPSHLYIGHHDTVEIRHLRK
jgi:hypothetical protein